MADTDEAILKVQKLEETVRDHINTHRYQSVLIEDSESWDQICSSLDVIGDTILAIKDEVTFRKLLRMMLTRRGFRVELAGSTVSR